MKAFHFGSLAATVCRSGFTLIALWLTFGLGVSAAAQWRPALPVRITFTERFVSGLEPEVDLRPQIRQRHIAIRDQGNRGTCTVFATTFLIEYQKAGMVGSTGGPLLSEEYLNWAGNKSTGENSDGGFFTKFISGYHAWGIAPAKDMRYRATYNATHPDTPSKAAIAAAQAMFPQKYPITILKVWDDTKGMTKGELQHVLATLRSGRPVATGIWWLNTFATVNVQGVPLLKDYPRSANSNSNPSLNPMFDGHSIDLVGLPRVEGVPRRRVLRLSQQHGTEFR